MKAYPTQEELKEYFRYEPDTGKLFWIKKSADKVVVGNEAGCYTMDKSRPSYITVGFNGELYWAHRLIWIMENGKLPEEGLVIDHKNKIRNDNRLVNLREASRYQNAQNVSLLNTNTTGFRGVSKTTNGKYRAYIYHKKLYCLGTYSDIDDAITARNTKEAELFGDFACTGSLSITQSNE